MWSHILLKAIASLSFCVKKSIWFPCHPFSSLCEREGVQAARCEADLFQRALCNGWRLCMDRRVHLRFFFHDIIAVTLLWSEAFDLTGVGPYFGHPQPPYRLGMALILLLFSDRPTMQPAERTLWLRVIGFISSLSARWMWKDNLTLFGQKASSCLYNPKHLRRNSLCRYCTFHRKPDFPPSLPCFFSADLTGYLLLLPQRLNRGERAFCGIGAICIAN